MKFSYLVFVLFYLCLTLGNCDAPFADNQDLDLRLKEILKSKKGGLIQFILPESSDYCSIPQDSSNPLSNEKVKLGQLLFFDPAISFDPRCKAAARTFSCATCHFASAGFQSGTRQAIAGGGRGHGFERQKHPFCDSSELDIQMLRTPSILNCAYQEVQLWSGKLGGSGINKGQDSLWTKGSFVELNRLGMQGVETQARVALEAHGMRMDPELILNTDYIVYFDSVFKDVDPNLKYRRFSMAKAIAAYERTVLSNKAPFQNWLKGNKNALTSFQKKGAILFFGKAQCDQCHNGPALNSMSFHALAMNDMEGSDIIFKKDPPADAKLGRAGYTHLEEDMFKFKVPQLYNLKNVSYLGHGGNFCSVIEVIRYKNDAIPQNIKVANKYLSPYFQPLHLTECEMKALEDFILNGLFDPDLRRYEPTSVPSGFCFPNADKISKIQLRCK